MTVSPINMNTVANSSGGRLSNAQTKSSPSKAAVQAKIKRKPAAVHNNNNTPASASALSATSVSPSANKKTKKSSNTSGSSAKSNPSTTATATAASFDLEATLCPICDEACTCPKTTASIVVKSPKAVTVKKSVGGPVKKSLTTTKKKEKPKYLNANNKKLQSYELTESSEYEDYESDDVDNEQNTKKAVEDPALSFIRMIYSDEESLDEEEAYALYQATQLFSSSDDEEYDGGYTRGTDSETEYTSDSDSDSEDDDGFEYTVVEYVQPLKKPGSKTQFIAYDSDSDEEAAEQELTASFQDQLLLNTVGSEGEEGENEEMAEYESGNDSGSESDAYSASSENSNWLTYSVFDVDSDLPNLTGGIGGTSLSSHGSGTPDTLLFSTSSTDKIPNIAPQVLAAISAAAKHMAANNSANSHNGGSSSKYFSYITLKETAGEDVDGEEFLFFEEEGIESEDEAESVSSAITVDIDSDAELVSCDDSINSMDSLSDGGISEGEIEGEVEEDSFSDESGKKKRRINSISSSGVNNNKSNSASTSTAPVTCDFVSSLNRWNRVPIGAFRRSRRPSIPSFHHSVHPSNALKTFSADPTSLTLTSNNSNTNEDSFDERNPERSQSVVTWDELDLDIIPTSSNPNNPVLSSSPTSSSHPWPLPKRSRSVISSSTSNSNSLNTNNFEWLNNSNWNWEI